ncbi:uncharacterized protein [Ambystoma mexicanum]|uniref:uncharacterized protein n=1 Tax=Ambystoma mexicanum TaxID=8296 RepID=UPI0037E7E6F0
MTGRGASKKGLVDAGALRKALEIISRATTAQLESAVGEVTGEEGSGGGRPQRRAAADGALAAVVACTPTAGKGEMWESRGRKMRREIDRRAEGGLMSSGDQPERGEGYDSPRVEGSSREGRVRGNNSGGRGGGQVGVAGQRGRGGKYLQKSAGGRRRERSPSLEEGRVGRGTAPPDRRTGGGGRCAAPAVQMEVEGFGTAPPQSKQGEPRGHSTAPSNEDVRVEVGTPHPREEDQAEVPTAPPGRRQRSGGADAPGSEEDLQVISGRSPHPQCRSPLRMERRSSGVEARPQMAGVERDAVQRKGELAQVWIVGHSIVKWAGKEAEKRVFGRQLGCSYKEVVVRWHGLGGLRWDQLLPILAGMRERYGVPQVVMLHAGENDLVRDTGVALLRKMKRDLGWVRDIWPQAVVVWTKLLPRRVWRGARNEGAIERARKGINREMEKFCASLKVRVMDHKEITYEGFLVFRGDGVHLSIYGNSYYLADLSSWLGDWVKSLSGS